MYTKGIHKEGEDLEMNTLVIVLIAAVLLTAAYVFYGRWLSKKWGIDPKAETPAHKFEDGQDYVPTDGWTVFQSSVFFYCGSRTCNRSDSGSSIWMAPRTLMGINRRYFLRSSY